MIKYKAIISDFDGTLVGKTFEVSPIVKVAIGKFIKAGGIFTIATGKFFPGVVQNACRALNLSTPVITDGGAEILNPTSGEVLHAEYINDEDTQMLIQMLMDDTKIPFEVHKSGKIYTPNMELSKKFSYKKYYNLNETNFSDTGKVRLIITGMEKEADEFVEYKLKNQFPEVCFLRADNANSKGYDITSEKATKHLAILELLKILNLKSEEVAGVGDQYNDFPLFTAVGFKVAMGDAPEELKEFADLVVPTVDENGLVVLIEKILNEKI